MSALRFERVTYAYPGASRPALRDVSFEIEPGELCLLAGLSGHGKSTLLRAACGLVPHFHGGTFSGRTTVAGLDTRDHPPVRLGELMGALFQDPESQLVMGSVRAELALALESRGHGAGAVARGVEEVSLALGIDHLLDRSTHELSGGEQQRVALGAALTGRPRIVLLDEPTSQLDPVAGDELIGLLRRLNQEWDTTFLLSEHRLERCLPAADRVIALYEGHVVHDGSPGSFLDYAERFSPALQTPGAKLFALAGLRPLPVGVKQARRVLRCEGLLADGQVNARGREHHARPPLRPRVPAAVKVKGLWHEIERGPAILRGVDLCIQPGETMALMGRNGAGKSTLLRHLAGLLEPTRGRIERAGPVALLLQNPNDYLLRERVAEELSTTALQAAGLQDLAERNPRDLSGGERQRLALAIVAGEDASPALLALDEPTRGMDRETKGALALELGRRAAAGQAVIVATHDPEFAAACAQRAVLLADGRVIADGPACELLAGGWYFATETARILAGAAGALRPEQGAALLAQRQSATSRLSPADQPQASGSSTGSLAGGYA
jgi:energy-coupling factor transport system ATP-binding protein